MRMSREESGGGGKVQLRDPEEGERAVAEIDLSPDQDDRRVGAVLADLLYPRVANVAVGDVVVDREAKEEDVLKGSSFRARE